MKSELFDYLIIYFEFKSFSSVFHIVICKEKNSLTNALRISKILFMLVPLGTLHTLVNFYKEIDIIKTIINHKIRLE